MPKIRAYFGRLSQLLGVLDIELHVEEVTGVDKSLDVVVDIFNVANSSGTRLSKGDLALAKICSDWPEARDVMKQSLAQWSASGYRFDLVWLLRSVNTVLSGEAKFSFLHEKSAADVQNGLQRATKGVDACLNRIADQVCGLDHARGLALDAMRIPVMVRYLPRSAAAGHLGMRGRARQAAATGICRPRVWGRYLGLR